MSRPALAVLSLVLLLGFRCHDEEIRTLESEKSALMENTRPKADFWAAVERKGMALKKQKALAAEGATLRAKVEAAQAEVTGLETNLKDLRQRNAAASEDVRAAEAKAAAAEEELARRSRTLERFDEERRSAGSS